MFEKIRNFLPSLTQCWVIVFYLLVIGGLGVGTILSVVCSSLGYEISSLNPLVSYILPMIPAFLYILYGRKDPKGPVPLEKRDFGGISPFIVYPLLAFAILAIGFVSEPLSSLFPMPETMKQIFEKILSDSFWAFLTTVVAAPVIEEFLLRGIMMRGLLVHTTPTNAILWSSFFFALIHMNPWQAIGAFIAGAFLGWIYWRTHSLIACIFIHAINNGTAYFIQLMNPALPPDSTYKDLLNCPNDNLYYIVFVIFAVSLAAVLHYLNVKLPKGKFE